MEPKKNSKYDIHRHRTPFFFMGILVSLTVVIVAFQWESEKKETQHPEENPADIDLLFYPPKTDQLYNKKAPISKPVKITQVNFVETKNPISDIKESHPIETVDNTQNQNIVVALPPEDLENNFVLWAEVMPEPEGGMEGFYKVLKKNLKYPTTARRLHIEGKVFLEFIVNPSGKVDQVRIVKGIGGGCDEEAIRVLKLIDWKPGKQRGVPVRVKMVLPFHFKLQ